LSLAGGGVGLGDILILLHFASERPEGDFSFVENAVK